MSLSVSLKFSGTRDWNVWTMRRRGHICPLGDMGLCENLGIAPPSKGSLHTHTHLKPHGRAFSEGSPLGFNGSPKDHFFWRGGIPDPILRQTHMEPNGTFAF